MKEDEIRKRLQEYLEQLAVEELEEKIAPIDCQKKPNHPDCRPQTEYGGPLPPYMGP